MGEATHSDDAHQGSEPPTHKAIEALERVSEGFLVLNENWEVEYLNSRAKEIFAPAGEDFEGDTLCEYDPEDHLLPFYQACWKAMQEQEPVRFTEYYAPLDTWFEVRAHPSDSGLSIYFSDVTEQKRRQSTLHELNEIITDPEANFEETLYALFDLGCEHFGLAVGGITILDPEADLAEIEYSSDSSLVPEGATASYDESYSSIARAGGSVVDMPDTTPTRGDRKTWAKHGFGSYIGTHVAFDDPALKDRAVWFLGKGPRREFSSEDTEFHRLFAQWVRKAYESRQYEIHLQSKRDHLSRVSDGFFALNEDWEFVYLNQRVADALNAERKEIIGETLWDIFPKSIDEDGEREYRRAMETKEPRTFETYIDQVNRWLEVRLHPSESGMSVYVTDITPRKQRERKLRDLNIELRKQQKHNSRVTDGIFAVDTDWQITYANERAHDLINPDDIDLIGKSLWRVYPGLFGSDFESAYRKAMETGEVTCATDWYGEPHNSWFEARAYPSDDGLTVYFRDVTERRERQQALKAIVELEEIVRDTATAAINSESPECVKAQAVDRLADSDRYRLAWIGTPNPSGTQLTPDCVAGVGGSERYVDEITVDLEGETGGPGSEAVATREVVPTQNLQRDRRFKPWANTAAKYGFHSAVAVPLVYKGTFYGLLAIYSPDRHAFGEQACDVLEHLGELIAHAIHAAEQREALRTDTQTVVEYQSESVGDLVAQACDSMDVAYNPDKFRIKYRRILPGQAGNGNGNGDDSSGTMTAFASLTGMDPDRIGDVFTQFPAVESVHVLADSPIHADVIDGEATVPVRAELGAQSAAAIVHEHGGVADSACVDADSFRFTIRLPSNVDLRDLTAKFAERYPDVEIVRKETVERSTAGALVEDRQDPGPAANAAGAGAGATRQDLLASLTERQQDIIETAYGAGYFERPREHTGSEIADMLGCSSTTFSEHLRRAEQKIFGAAIEN